MTPGFRAVVNRLKGQGQNLFRRIRRIQRSTTIHLKGTSFGRQVSTWPAFCVIYCSETVSRQTTQLLMPTISRSGVSEG